MSNFDLDSLLLILDNMLNDLDTDNGDFADEF